MSKLILINAETSETICEFPLQIGQMTIGRTANNDIVLDSPSVSSHHAVIYRVKNDCFVHDTQSTNGTIINGNKIRNHALEDKDVLNIGSNVLVYSHSTQNTSGKKATEKLVILNGPDKGHEIPLKSSITTLGQPGEQLALISLRPEGYFLSHLDGGPSNNLSQVNGTPVTHEPVLLSLGDIITINNIELCLSQIKEANCKPLV